MKKKLQVFVSSTYEDLLEERQSAVQAVLNSGHIPAGMELFTAGDESQKETIKKWIDESDVYLLILGGRYGTVDKNTGKSYTHWEYDYAGTVGKPRFAVVIKDDALEEKVKIKGTKMMEKDNPALYKKFRSEVLKKMCKFYSDTKDIQLAIFQKLAEYSNSKELIGWVQGKEIATIEELTKLNEENRKLRRENEKLKQVLERKSNEIAIGKENNRAVHSEQFTIRVNRILKLLNFEETQDDISWYETDEDNMKFEHNVENILEKFVPYFEHTDKQKKDFNDINFVFIDNEAGDLNLHDMLCDIRLQLENLPQESDTVFKFIVISDRIEAEIKNTICKYFDSMLDRVDAEIKTKVRFEIWDSKEIDQIEERFGINFK